MPFRKEFLPYFLIIGFFGIIIISAFYFSFSGKKTTPNTPTPSSITKPVFSPQPKEIDNQNLQYHPDSSTKAQTIDESSQKMLDKDAAIGNLLPKVPYKGTFFTLEYSYQNNSFTASFSSSNQAQANQEFDQFLKSNQIENRNWLYNLQVVTK